MMSEDFNRNQQDISPSPKGVRRVNLPLENFDGFAQAFGPPRSERFGTFNAKDLIH